MDIEEIIRRIVREEIRSALIVAPSRPARETVVVDERRLYSVASAAKLLGVDIGYVYSRIKSGEIAVVELATAMRSKQRISAPELDRFITSRTFGSGK